MTENDLKAINLALDADDDDAVGAITDQLVAAMSPAERAQHYADVAADDDDDTETPAARATTPPAATAVTPTPAPPPKQASGLGRDGVFRATDAQLRDPVWCDRHAKDRIRAGLNCEIIPE